jgi:hypothetical protein
VVAGSNPVSPTTFEQIRGGFGFIPDRLNCTKHALDSNADSNGSLRGREAYPLTLAGPHAVAEHAMFPAMSAVESMNTAGLLVARRRSHRQTHLSEVLQLCRVEMECAALTIWLLGDPAREVRRDRCMSQEMEQLEQRRRYLVIDAETEANRGSRFSPQLRAMNADHRREFNDLLDKAKAAHTFTKTPSFTATIRSSAQWVDLHVPAHDNGEIASNGLEDVARSFYSYGSSFIHGYKWMTEYARGGTIFSLIADALAATLNMVECAVCLYEAASRAPGGARPDESWVPDRFEPTIVAWSVELFDA